jgi:hypothetical protein
LKATRRSASLPAAGRTGSAAAAEVHALVE